MKKKWILLSIVVVLIPLTSFALPQLSLVREKAIESAQEETARQEKISDRDKLREERYKEYISSIEQFRECTQDSDCVRVDDGPCGCGGAGKDTAVNGLFLENAESIHRRIYFNTGCAAMMSDDISCISPPICINSKCTIDTENSSVCAKKEDPNRCYYEFALLQNSVELCDKLQTEKINNSRQGCLMNIAVQLEDISPCDRLENEERLDCRDDFFYRLARHTKDYELCLKITGNEDKDECLYNILLHGTDTKKCEIISDQDKVDSCVGNILLERAKNKENPGICSDVPEESMRNRCFSEAGALTTNPDYCRKDEKYKSSYFDCLREVAKRTGDYELCDEFGRNRFSCILDVIGAGNMKLEEAQKICNEFGVNDGKKCLHEVNNAYL